MVEKERCCGCSACYNACPVGCIKMVEDQLGFLFPVIDEKVCVHCGLCESVCPILNSLQVEQYPILCWGGHAVNQEIRQASSSGGLFSILALSVIDNGGVVFGAALENDCNEVRHIMVTNKEDLKKLRGSKYVQSIIGNTYLVAKKYLLEGKQVLYSGTPCQIHGLNLFLSHDYENLLTVEVICHGVPSPNLYRKYIDYISRKLGSKIRKVMFRDEFGGVILKMRIESDIGKIYSKDMNSDPFYRLFLSNQCLRESCYKCPSRGFYKRADITLSDFWGVENVAPDLTDGGGLSLVMVHSIKGEKAFLQIKKSINGRNVDYKEALGGNPLFYESVKKSRLRDTFMYDIDWMSIEKLEFKYAIGKKEKIRRIFMKLQHVLINFAYLMKPKR